MPVTPSSRLDILGAHLTPIERDLLDGLADIIADDLLRCQGAVEKTPELRGDTAPRGESSC